MRDSLDAVYHIIAHRISYDSPIQALFLYAPRGAHLGGFWPRRMDIPEEFHLCGVGVGLAMIFTGWPTEERSCRGDNRISDC